MSDTDKHRGPSQAPGPEHPDSGSLAAPDTAIADLLSALSLEEKALLTSGRDMWSTQPIERLDIRPLWLADGPHGLRRAPETHSMGYGDQLPATCFPTASALAATWDVELLREVGTALGVEARSLGVDILLGPGVNIKRSVLGGRNFEYFSEDPYLSGKLGAAYIQGVQSCGVGTSLKHFAANDVETERMWANSAVDSRTLHEIHLQPFEIAIREANPWTVMACYNRVQGHYGTESTDLLTHTLKNDWGFTGAVISDWDAVIDRVQGIRAGMHLEMPGRSARLSNRMIVDAVRSGELPEAQLDTVVRDILQLLHRARVAAENSDRSEQSLDSHHRLARRVAAETITLLKNDGALLPIPGRVGRIAVIGEFAVDPRFQGNGSSEVKPPRLDRLVDILGEEYASAVEFSYLPGYRLSDDEDDSLIAAATAGAADADLALVLAGLPLHYESEGIDRRHIDLPPAQNRLIEAVAEAQPSTVVVLTNGSAVAMPWADRVPAIVEAWLGGQAGAGAVTDVLFGRVNPSGKLAETFPMRLEDTPAFLNFPAESGEVLYGERVFVGYRYYDTRRMEPLFPFGHGLSYTRFDYAELSISTDVPTERQVQTTVRATITNSGARTGKEVVQLYIGDPQSSVRRPEKELRGFRKLELAPGESRRVEFVLGERDFAFYSTVHGDWLAESGEFEIMLGSSSRDIRLNHRQHISFSREVNYQLTEFSFLRAFWSDAQLRPLLVDLMPAWLGTHVKNGQSIDDALIPDFLLDQPLVKFVYFSDGELSVDAVRDLVVRCNALTYTP